MQRGGNSPSSFPSSPCHSYPTFPSSVPCSLSLSPQALPKPSLMLIPSFPHPYLGLYPSVLSALASSFPILTPSFPHPYLVFYPRTLSNTLTHSFPSSVPRSLSQSQNSYSTHPLTSTPLRRHPPFSPPSLSLLPWACSISIRLCLRCVTIISRHFLATACASRRRVMTEGAHDYTPTAHCMHMNSIHTGCFSYILLLLLLFFA